MYVQSDTLAKWKSLYQSGDKTKIAEQYQAIYQKASLSTVQGWLSTGFKLGFFPDKLVPVVKSFYDKVEKQLQK